MKSRNYIHLQTDIQTVLENKAQCQPFILSSANVRILLWHIVPSKKYWGHDIVGKLAYRKFHQSFPPDLTMWLLLSLILKLSTQNVGDYRDIVSPNRVSNGSAWLVSETGTFLSTDIPHMWTNAQSNHHTG